MILLLSLCIAFPLVWLHSSPLLKYPVGSYLVSLAAAVLTITAVWTGRTQSIDGALAVVSGIFTQGGLAAALFILVMLAGAAKNGGAYIRRVMPIRGEASIAASILALGHNIAFGRNYFLRLFTNYAELRPNVLAAAMCSLAMIAIMLPLFVSSFKTVRRKMNPRKWKRLQRTAYVFYALLYIHVLLLNLTGVQEGKWQAILNVILYSAIFAAYSILRIRKAMRKRKKTILSHIVTIAGVILWAVSLAFIFLAIPAEKEADFIPANDYLDGKYTGAALGYNGRLKVRVTIEAGKICDLQLTSSVEDEPYQSRSTQAVFEQAIRTNGAQIDTVSGATSTADALIEAIHSALEKAIPPE